MGLPTSPDCLHAPILPPHPHKSTVSPRAPPSQGQGLSGQRAGPFIVQMGKSSQGGAVSCRGSHSQPAGPSSFCPRPLTWLSSKDKLLKLHKYANAGVREYWIVDPDRQTVLVYDLEHENYYPDKYTFEDRIPIKISGGECSIDFARIMRRIERYYKE